MSEKEKIEADSAASTESNQRSLWKPIALIVGVIVLLVLAKVLGLGQYLEKLKPWIEDLGPWGPVAFVALYVAASIAAIPGSALTIAAGALFGSVWGVVWTSVASTLAAASCFLIARYVARSAIEKSLKNNPKFEKLDAMTAKQGALIVAITRLVPLFPFNLLNYGFGLTKVRFVTYVFWSWLCMLPGTILYVVGADAVKKAVVSGEIPWSLVGVVIAAIIVLALIGKAARGKLDDSDEKIEAKA